MEQSQTKEFRRGKEREGFDLHFLGGKGERMEQSLE